MKAVLVPFTVLALVMMESISLVPKMSASDTIGASRFEKGPLGLVHAQRRAPQPDPPGTIDGSKSPELIPDDVAYRVLFLAVAEPENATERQKARARGKIFLAGLSERDTEAFLLVISRFHTGIVAIDAQVGQIRSRNPRPEPTSTDGQRLRELAGQRDHVISNTKAALPANLTPDGMAQLDAYLQQAKRGMKIIPDNWMSQKMR